MVSLVVIKIKIICLDSNKVAGKGKNGNNWQNQFGFSNNQPNFQNTGPIAPQQYPQWYLYQQYQNMQQNQPIVKIQPAQVQKTRTTCNNNNTSLEIRQRKLKFNFPVDFLHQGFDHQQNAATSVESFITQQVNAGGDKNHNDKMQRSCFQMSQKTYKATESVPKIISII